MEQPFENEDNYIKEETFSTKIKHNQKDKSIFNITNIDIPAQLSKDESETGTGTMDDGFNTLNGYPKGSCRAYEISLKKTKQYSQTYETLKEVDENEDNSSDESSSYFSHLNKRQMEPLYIGDVMKYHDISMGLDQF